MRTQHRHRKDYRPHEFSPKRVRDVRGGLSIRKFAALVGVPFTTLHGWERGGHKPNINNLLKLQTLTGRSVCYFFVPKYPVPNQT